MSRHKSRAFVLSAADYRETSKLLHLFCENEGRISVIGRGLRSPKSKKAQLADAFNLLQVGYNLKDGATLGALTSIEPERLFSGLRRHLDAYALGSYWFEIIKTASQARLAPRGLFGLTEQLLQSLDASGYIELPSIRLCLALLEELGFGMQLLRCAECGRPGDLRRFNMNAGAVYCTYCSTGSGRSISLAAPLLQLITALQSPASGPQLDPASTLAFLQLYNEFLTLHLEQRLKTFQFLQDVLGAAKP
jgi:DNA repair protein RecO (recombination protein O)